MENVQTAILAALVGAGLYYLAKNRDQGGGSTGGNAGEPTSPGGSFDGAIGVQYPLPDWGGVLWPGPAPVIEDSGGGLVGGVQF